MEPAFTIRRLETADAPAYRELRLRSLADSPDAFGSTWEAEQALPPTHWQDRLSAAAVSGRDCPLVAERDGAALGLLWARQDTAQPALVNLFQMWVAPESRGCGVASALLREAIAWAQSMQASVVQLGVTCGDTPAARLYARAGFLPHGEPEPLGDGSPLLSQPMRLALHREQAA
ncbi:GNAT family N-acetyltransferase [Pseudoduganella sp. GCM10020061]|uniref:GNAT family N-acetyltransferase n=1 Tax=Pseudoduganella sp. GCM10020061 TaxID=3317345 RepID=UPI00363809C8